MSIRPVHCFKSIKSMTSKTKITVGIHHYGGQVPDLQSASCTGPDVHHDELRCVRYANTSCETASWCQHQRAQFSVRLPGELSCFASTQTLRSPPVKVPDFRQETVSRHTRTSASSCQRECVIGPWSRGELSKSVVRSLSSSGTISRTDFVDTSVVR